MGWTLDAFDFTVFLFITAPIAQEFGLKHDGRPGRESRPLSIERQTERDERNTPVMRLCARRLRGGS